MAKKYNQYNLIEFQKTFSDDEACEQHLLKQRWESGFICPKCGHEKAWYLKNRKLFDC